MRAAQRRVVATEANQCCDYTEYRAADDIDALVLEVDIAGAADVDCDSDRNKEENMSKDWRCRTCSTII